MTTLEKLDFYHQETGRSWSGIADLLGVSRQMLNAVRDGSRRFSPHNEAALDSLLSELKAVRHLKGALSTTELSPFPRDPIQQAACAACAVKDSEIAFLRDALKSALARIPTHQ